MNYGGMGLLGIGSPRTVKAVYIANVAFEKLRVDKVELEVLIEKEELEILLEQSEGYSHSLHGDLEILENKVLSFVMMYTLPKRGSSRMTLP